MMPTPTYVPLATLSLASADSSITFSSIPATYRDLIVVSRVEFTALTGMQMRVNGNSSSIYSTFSLRGPVASSSATNTQWFLSVSGLSANVDAFSMVQIMDYAQTDKQTTALGRLGTIGESLVEASAFRWASTDAVNSVTVFANASTFKVGSTFSLYGVN